MEMIIESLSELKSLPDPVPLLLDMKETLQSMPNASRNIKEYFYTRQKLISHVIPLFETLATNNSEQVEIAVDILNIMFRNIDSRGAYIQLNEHYLQALYHPNEAVQFFILKQLLRHCEEYGGDGVTKILRNRHLLNNILRLLGDKSMEVIKRAHDLIRILCTEGHHPNDGYLVIFDSTGFAVLREVMKVSDSARFHVYEMIVEISCLSEQALLHMTTFGFITNLNDEISSGDALTQLNALELLSKVATNADGLRSLQAAGILTKLSLLLSEARNNSVTVVLLPGIVKFFSYVGTVQPTLLTSDHPSVLVEIIRVTSDVDSSRDISLRLLAFETVVEIGLIQDGKYALVNCSSEVELALKALSPLLKSSTSGIKVRLLDAYAKLMDLKDGIWWTPELTRLTSERKLALKRLHRKKTAENEAAFKKLRTDAHRIIRSTRNKFYARYLPSREKKDQRPEPTKKDEAVCKMEEWFDHIVEESTITFLVDLAKQPFPDVALSCLRILKSLANLPWGNRKMEQEPGMFDWFLDRNSFLDKSTKELRWEVVGILSKDPVAKEIFSEELQERITTFYSQGPFYVEAENSTSASIE